MYFVFALIEDVNPNKDLTECYGEDAIPIMELRFKYESLGQAQKMVESIKGNPYYKAVDLLDLDGEKVLSSDWVTNVIYGGGVEYTRTPEMWIHYGMYGTFDRYKRGWL